MTKDEILAALENARMDLERAIATVQKLPEPHNSTYALETTKNYLRHRTNKLKEKTNER